MESNTITLEQMLAARDRRAEIQRKLLCRAEAQRDSLCLVCLTLNIAGDVKRTPMTRILFDRGVSEFEALGCDVADSCMIDSVTGSEAFWLLREDGPRVKSRLERIEDSFPAARLFDFDVLLPAADISAMHGAAAAPGFPYQPAKLSRALPRRCLVCDRPAAQCARSRNHGLAAVQHATVRLLEEFCADTLAKAAHDSLLDELYTTPKPGLVDLNNNGAHTDLNIPLFEQSAAALLPYFHDAAILGMHGAEMPELRHRGLAAEQEMFTATGGVNTHKGMIYSMGLLLAGMGRILSGSSFISLSDQPLPAGQDTFHASWHNTCTAPAESYTSWHSIYPDNCDPGCRQSESYLCKCIRCASEIAQQDASPVLAGRLHSASQAAELSSHIAEFSLSRDYSACAASDSPAAQCGVTPAHSADVSAGTQSYRAPTHGETAFRLYGATGIAGEASAGFPHAVYALGRLRHYRNTLGATASISHSGSRLVHISPLRSHDSGAESPFADPGALVLCDLIAVLEDTNLIHRGGMEGLESARKEAGRISSLSINERLPALAEFDSEMIRRNLSPGGCADMLALAFFLDRWELLTADL